MTFDLTRLPDDFIDNPHPHYAALRERHPVCEMAGGGLFLSRHADLVRVYKDRRTFSSDKKVEFYPKFGDSLLYQHHTTSLVFNDAPLHTRVRRAIAGALSPRATTGMDVVVQRLVDGLIEDLEARHRASMQIDAVAHFAQNIPIEVIGNLLAIPRAERAPLRDWSLAILGALEPEISPRQFEDGEAAVREFLAYLEAIVARRRAEGVDDASDIMARLIRETGEADEDANLLPHELLQNCIFILNAGHETTTNLICSGIFLLAQRPQIVARLAENPELWPAAIEEILRMESPNQLGNAAPSPISRWVAGAGQPAHWSRLAWGPPTATRRCSTSQMNSVSTAATIRILPLPAGCMSAPATASHESRARSHWQACLVAGLICRWRPACGARRGSGSAALN